MSTTTDTAKPAAPAAAPRPRRPRPQVMSVTPLAAERVKALIDGRGKPTAGIRIGVRTKGCSGMSYTLEFADKQEPMDEVVEAAALNDAYRTLKDPLGRAVYLAGLKGVDLPGDGKTIDDPDLLMEAMEAREELHEASSGEAVEALAAKARGEMTKAMAALGSLFLANDRPAIRKTLLRLRYLDKFAEEARARRMNIERSRA